MRFIPSVLVLAVVAALVSMPAPLHAQVTTATLYGVVRNSSAAPVPERSPRSQTRAPGCREKRSPTRAASSR